MINLEFLDQNEESFPAYMGKRPYTSLGMLVGGTLLVAAAYVPLLQYNPSNPPTWIYTFSYATSWGIEMLDLIYLVPAGVAIAVLAILGPTRRWAGIAVFAGLWAVLLQGLLLLHQYVYTDFWLIPSVGWVVAILGGIIIMLLGGHVLSEIK